MGCSPQAPHSTSYVVNATPAVRTTHQERESSPEAAASNAPVTSLAKSKEEQKKSPDEEIPTTEVQASSTPYIVVPFPASEANCGNVDLSAQSGPVKDQGAHNICYAYSAVELMNFPSHSKSSSEASPPEERVEISAFATAIEYGMGMKSGLTSSYRIEDAVGGMDGGNAGNAIRAVRNHGACLESEIRSYDQKVGSLSQIYSVYRALQDFRYRNATPITPADADPYLKLMHGEAGKVFSVLTPEEKLLDPKLSFESYLRTLWDLSCSKKKMNLPTWGGRVAEYSVKDQRDRLRAFSYIHQTLDVGYPAGISFKADLIQDPRPNQNFTTDSHATTVMGRKYLNDGKRGKGCYFLIKNSWGPQWPSAHELDSKMAWADPSKPGYFWIKDEDLATRTSGFTYVEVMP